MQDKNPFVDQLFCAFLNVLDIYTTDESSFFHWFSVVSWYTETKCDISIILTGHVEDMSTITLQVSSSESLLSLYF